MNHELSLQVKERQAMDAAEMDERKAPVMTSGGPTMLHVDAQEIENRAKQ